MKPAIIQIAKERHRINQEIRTFLFERGYLEVETPLIVRSPGMEPNLNPFETMVTEPDQTKHTAGLITSPEYSMKKLLGQGLEKIFCLTKVFRNEEEFGNTHNPEFSMIEWYQQGSDYHACMDETEAMIKAVASGLIEYADESVGHDMRTWSDPDIKWKRVRVRDLFLQHMQLDLDTATHETLVQACSQHQIHWVQEDTVSDLFYRLFLARIEPNLGHEPIFVYDYPIYQASLSQLTADGRYGQRFELYIHGLELCNGFTELTDAQEQRARFLQEAQERQNLGKTVYPIDEELLALLPSLRNPTYGNALGIDRLHMVITGRSSIEEVLLFPCRNLFPPFIS